MVHYKLTLYILYKIYICMYMRYIYIYIDSIVYTIEYKVIINHIIIVILDGF